MVGGSTSPPSSRKGGWGGTYYDYLDLDLALKLPIIIVKDGLSPLTKLSKLSKFDKNSSNSTIDWLGDR